MADEDLVTNQFHLVQDYASEAFTLAEKYIDQLNSYIIATISMTPPSIDVPAITSITIDPSISAQLPVAPADSDYPVAPSVPSTTDFSFPSQPSFVFPSVPVMTDIVIPDFIDQAISPITLTIPTIDFDVPATPAINTGDDVPHDTLVQAAKAKLESNILNGGTMINSDVEDDIWNRDLERNEQALQDAIDKLSSTWSKLGWSLPDGLLANSITTINKEYMNKLLDRSREIAVKQAELEQAGMFKSLELTTSLESVLIGSHNEYAKRVLESSKATADVTIQIFKERVNRYNAMLEAFKTDVVTYKTGIEAEQVRAEVYKAKLSGAQILATIDETKVKAYATHISAISEMVNVYGTQVKAVAVMYEAERQKIERYKAQVDAYTSTIDAITKKYLAKTEGFKSYVQAWTATSDSQTKLTELSTRAKIAELDATLKEWEIQLKLIQENTTLRLEALKAVAQTASNLAAGALSAGHASASAGYSHSWSNAVNQNYSY